MIAIKHVRPSGLYRSRLVSVRSILLAGASSLLLPGLALAQDDDVEIVQPGAPGQASKALTAEDAVNIADNRFSPDDVRFMQDMIPHHFQATEMAALVEGRTNNSDLIEVAGRITASQADEIAFMRDWLLERGEKAPDPAAHANGEHKGHGATQIKTHMTHAMMGMASPAQMEALAAAEGVDFDKLFLQLMIRHHEGAIDMVERLLQQPGSAYDPTLFEFATGITNDQTAEITQMNAVFAGLSEDPRAGLKPGFRDAGEAIANLTKIAALAKPRGFFDAENPADLPPVIASDASADDEADADDRDDGEESANENTRWGSRSPLLSFANTDMAFAGDVMVAGNYHGFNVYKLADDGTPKLYSSVVCPGGQGDVSIVGDILIMSVEQTRGRVDCGLEGISEDVSAERFRGLRIFDISNLKRPVQVGQVQTCRGSHTHSVVSGPGRDGKIIVYNSGTAGVRSDEELEGCVGDVPGDDRTALFRIDVIEIPVDDPSEARIIDSPGVFADPKTGRLAGLWQGGDHGDETQRTRRTDQCHDITVFPSKKIAAGACSGNGIILDISNPRAPKRIDDVTDRGFAYWHSATFNNDGTKVIFTDEWGGGSRPRCRPSDPETWGADAIYDIVDNKLAFGNYYKMPAPQSDKENCVAHNGSVVPVPGRDIFVQAWYQGGLSILDFTDSANPVEIAYFDRGPIDKDNLILGGYWSTYWYDGKIYGTEISRGIDVFALAPSEFLTENEIAAAELADQGETFNPQQQFPVSWPAKPVVARAYMDQLARHGSLADDMAEKVTGLVDQAAAKMEAGEKDAELAKSIKAAVKDMPKIEGIASRSASGLADTLTAMADALK